MARMDQVPPCLTDYENPSARRARLQPCCITGSRRMARITRHRPALPPCGRKSLLHEGHGVQPCRITVRLLRALAPEVRLCGNAGPNAIFRCHEKPLRFGGQRNSPQLVGNTVPGAEALCARNSMARLKPCPSLVSSLQPVNGSAYFASASFLAFAGLAVGSFLFSIR